jgi:hypothetical protein
MLIPCLLQPTGKLTLKGCYGDSLYSADTIISYKHSTGCQNICDKNEKLKRKHTSSKTLPDHRMIVFAHPSKSTLKTNRYSSESTDVANL